MSGAAAAAAPTRSRSPSSARRSRAKRGSAPRRNISRPSAIASLGRAASRSARVLGLRHRLNRSSTRAPDRARVAPTLRAKSRICRARSIAGPRSSCASSSGKPGLRIRSVGFTLLHTSRPRTEANLRARFRGQGVRTGSLASPCSRQPRGNVAGQVSPHARLPSRRSERSRDRGCKPRRARNTNETRCPGCCLTNPSRAACPSGGERHRPKLSRILVVCDSRDGIAKRRCDKPGLPTIRQAI